MPFDPKHWSRTITDGPSRAGARSMLKAIGFTDADLAKPIVGIANTWIETMPCTYPRRRLAEKVKAGIRAAGGTPMEFNTISISDGVTMGTEGMKASLISREVIADSIELVGRGHMFDAIVALVGCDKTTPAQLMGAASADVPALMVPGGPMLRGMWRGTEVGSGTDVRRFWEEVRAGRMTEEEWCEVESCVSRSAGHCTVMGTASTMAALAEALGMALPGSAAIPAVHADRQRAAEASGLMAIESHSWDHNHECLGRTATRAERGTFRVRDEAEAEREGGEAARRARERRGTRRRQQAGRYSLRQHRHAVVGLSQGRGRPPA